MTKINSRQFFLITNDVETTSLWNHCLNDKTGEKVLKEGMPRLLELYQQYGIKTTFFFTGYIAKLFPDIVRMIIPYGHEVASHGLTHEPDKAFNVLSYGEQIKNLDKAKKILEDISGESVVSFRAPALRVNRFTPRALEKTGFLIDSSVAPQRMDFIFSFGVGAKIIWMFSPRSPYFTRHDNLAFRGESNIYEIPISSFGIPYTGTVMRISPLLIKLVRKILLIESRVFQKPVIFLIHPNELINEEVFVTEIRRRTSSRLEYVFGDKIRYLLKLKNLGSSAIPLLKDQIVYFKDKAFASMTCRMYYQHFSKQVKE